MSGLRILPSWSYSRKLILFLMIMLLPICVATVASGLMQRYHSIREAGYRTPFLAKGMACRFPGGLDLPLRCSMAIPDYRETPSYRPPDYGDAASGMRSAPKTVRLTSCETDHGVLQRSMGDDGTNRICAFQRLHLGVNSPPCGFLGIAIPKDETLRTANLHLHGGFSILGIALCLILLAAGGIGSKRTDAFPGEADEESDSEAPARPAGIMETNGNPSMERTEREQLEAALQAALARAEDEKSRSESIMASLSDGLTIIDRDFRIEFQNGVSRAVMGDHVNEYCYRAFHDRDNVCMECPMVTCFNEACVHKKEITRATGGKTVCAEIAVSPLKSAKGEVIGAIELVRDITVRKQAERILKESEVKYRTLFENATDAIFLILDYKFIDCNDATLNIYGCTREQIIGSHPYDYSPPVQPDGSDSRDTATERITEALAGNPQFFEWRHSRPDGTQFDAEVSLNRIELGDQMLVQAIVRDVTNRKRSDQALQESAWFQQQLIDALPIPVFYKDPEGRYLGSNKAFAALLNLKKDEIIGKTAFEVFPTELASVYHEKDSALFRDPSVQIYESTITDTDGSIHNVVFHKATFSRPDGSVGGLIGALLDITERKTAEDALISANRQLNDIIEFLPDATVVLDMEMKVIAWNRAIEDMTGVSKQQVIGKRRDAITAPFLRERRSYLFDLIGVRDKELESRYRHIVRKGDILYAQTYVPYLQGGKGAYVFATAAPLFDAHGNRVGAIEIIRDITDQVQAQEALRISEEKYRELVENANSIILRMDKHGNVTFINEFAQRFFSYTEKEILGRNVVGTIVPPVETGGRDLRAMIEDIAMNPDRYASNVNENMRRDGDRVWIAWTYKPIRYQDGPLMEVLCVGNDVTERKVMEETLVEAEARYRSIFENSLMGIFQSTPRGHLLKLNKAFSRILGYDSPEDVLNKVSDIAQQHYVIPARRAELLHLIEEREMVQDFEAEIYRRDRSVAWITLNTRAVRGTDGKIVHLEGTVQDITDSKLLESQLNQARKMEAIGTLAGGIAHDFNNILTPILGYSEISLNEVPSNGQLYHNLEQIFLSANRARELVKQILTFSRKGEQSPRPVQVSLLIKETLKLLRSSLPSTIEIRQELDRDATDNTVMADPIQIHQVLMNLCTNAAHAMREKGGVLTIALRNEDIQSGARTEIADLEPGAYLRLSVVDTGHGMDEATKERIFEPYFTTKGSSEGTGLGLALVYGITRSLSGGIAVRSKPGHGTTFDVYFPRTRSIQAPAVPASSHLPTGKGHILVVDDEKPIVDMLKAMLLRLGYDITETYSSHDALRTFSAQPNNFDLVISDLTMPHMTGIDLTKEILRIRPDTPIILCTGFSEPVDEDRSKLLGIREFLMKPVAMRDLAAAVNRILAGEKVSK